MRNEVLRALPAELPDSAIDPILDLLTDEATAPLGIQLLSRVPPNRATVEAVTARLATASPRDVERLVPVLDRCTQNEAVRDLLWNLAETDPNLSVRELALQCLERAGDDRELPADVDSWPPQLRYRAARIGIARGDIRGADRLIDLLGAEGGATIDNELAGRCRMDLSRLSGLPPHSTTEAFAAWRQRTDALPNARAPGDAR